MTEREKGNFIVLEGIDGCGGETQLSKLIEHFKNERVPAEKLTYPDYTGPIGKLIHEYLYKQYDFSKEVQFLLYFGDFLKDSEKIQGWLNMGKTIVSDRYFTSTLAYQCLNGFPLEKALQVSELFNLVRPSLIIYLDITAETSMKRKAQEKGGDLDRNESDRQFLSDLVHSYTQLIEKQTFAPWVVVDGEQPIEKVTKDIIRVLN